MDIFFSAVEDLWESYLKLFSLGFLLFVFTIEITIGFKVMVLMLKRWVDNLDGYESKSEERFKRYIAFLNYYEYGISEENKENL